MTKFFISHSSQDDGFVHELQQALGDLMQDVWIDSRELRGGDPLWPVIQKAIEDGSVYAVVVSPDGLQSKWVGKELRHALKVQKRKGGKDKFPVIPLSLNDTKLGVLHEFFGEEPVYVPVSSAPGGVNAALNAILVALGKRLPADVPPRLQPKAEPLEELVLELTNLEFHTQDGVRRASAHARLVYEPATHRQPQVVSAQNWRFIAPIGPIEAEELRWYLEKYAIWPSLYFHPRAHKVQESLTRWGQLLYQAAMPVPYTANVMNAWARIGEHDSRRFSVHVDSSLEVGRAIVEAETSREVATILLGLPWELLHDGNTFLFQGAKPTRVRRRLPNTRVLDVPVVATPIRILLVTARPEDDACSYIDHRVSALPLVEAMEALGGLVRTHVLNPPTLTALREELDRARKVRMPYHVVHFDGHGVYDRKVALGALCFEHPEDIDKLEKRRHVIVFTSELGPLLRDHRIPLVFLEACQTAQAEKASESVASELLKVGVASVVAMSHSVLVETARRFVEAFYSALAQGNRVGDAMLEGQRRLKDDTFRGLIFGAGELRLEDWFVPVLFQEKDDPQLFSTTPTRQTQEDLKTALKARLGELPEEPLTGFIGRSRELLALQRLLCNHRYAVVRGQGGEGKTALAAEFARWMVRSHQIHRAAFVSVETHSNLAAVLNAIGRQLVPGYSVATFKDLEKAILPIERLLTEQSTLLVMDNMESILLPPYIETSEVLSEEARRELEEILRLCLRLNGRGDTRLVFTSREALPAPFRAEPHWLELDQLAREDAVKLMERVLNQDSAGAGAASDAAREEIEQLVEAVHCHARTLALLAPAVQNQGVEATYVSLVELMAEMERKFPGNREKSLFASVELSLGRMSPANQDRAQALAVFHGGGVHLDVLRLMMEWQAEDVTSLARELIGTGLATLYRYGHLTLNPALCPYLRGQIDAAKHDTLAASWNEAMHLYVVFLVRQWSQNTEVATTLTVLDLPNLFSFLEQVQEEGDAERTLDLADSLYNLLQNAGRPRLLERLAQVRDTAEEFLGQGWNHARFQVQRARIEQLCAIGRLREGFDGAKKLLQSARAAGEKAYPGADYDLAYATYLPALVLKSASASEQSLPLLDEAQKRFEAVEPGRFRKAALKMASACIIERASCLCALGRLEEAVAAYEKGIQRSEELVAERDVAVGKAGLGTVRMLQHRYQEALKAHEEARDWFMQLGEPHSVATAWHQIGIVYQLSEKPDAAEDAYQKSLAIKVRLGDTLGQANTLNQLGIFYDDVLGRTEEAVAFISQAADKYFAIGNTVNEGKARSNLAIRLGKLRRLDEARRETLRAIECTTQFGHAAQPWISWSILSSLEMNVGNSAAAAEAKGKAIESYLAYRRDGGENQDADGLTCLAVSQSMLSGNPAAAASFLQQLAAEPDLPSDARNFIQVLQAIVTGSRDCTLADSPEFNYSMAAEILFLIETLLAAPVG